MIWIFNREDRLVLICGNDQPEALPIISAEMHEVLNGDINLDFEVPLDHTAAALIEEGYSAAVQRSNGAYELFIISEIQEIKGTTESTLAIACRHAIQELNDETILSYAADRKDASIVLPALLEGTRWTAGTIENTSVHDLTVENESVLEALSTFIDRWQGEVAFTFEIFTDRITRTIHFYQQRGQDAGRRFEWTRDLESLKRTIDSSEVKTALIGIGSQELTTTDAEGNEQTETVNLYFTDLASADPAKPAGQIYIEDPEALEKWGRVNTDGSKRNRFGFFEDSEINDPTLLLETTWALLQILKTPKISYEIEVLDLAKLEGAKYRAVDLGDTVRVIDDQLEIQITARVLEIKHDLIQKERTKILLDNFQDILTAGDKIEDPSLRIEKLENIIDNKLDRGETIRTNWLEDEINLLTQQIRAGGGTVTMNDGQGILIEEDPETKQGGAIRLLGGQLALANTYNAAAGDYNWRAFGTGSGWLADLTETGFLKFNRAKGGTLTLGGDQVGTTEEGEPLYENGVLVVKDSKGSDIATLDGNYGGFDSLRIDWLKDTQNVMFVTNKETEGLQADGIIYYYVDAYNGSNSNTGTTKEDPLASIQAAIDRLPKYLNHSVYIYFTAGLLQDDEIRIEGFSGTGEITLQQEHGFTVRYIRDWLHGSTSNPSCHWYEVNLLTEGGNNGHASGLEDRILTNSLDADGSKHNAATIGRVSDSGNATGYWDAGSNNGEPVYVDVYTGGGYTDTKAIRVWHYYPDGRTYYGTKTEVSEDRNLWRTVFDSEREGTYKETADGHIIYVHKAYLKGRLIVKQNSVSVYVKDLFIDAAGTGSYACYFYRTHFAEVRDCVIFGDPNQSYAFYCQASIGRIIYSEVNTSSYALILSAYGGYLEVSHVVGSGSPRSMYAAGNAMIFGTGTCPYASTQQQRGSGGMFSGTWTSTTGEFSPITVTTKVKTWNNNDSQSWNEGSNGWHTADKDVLQGKWDTWGRYRGCWFFGSGVTNTVKGKTIKKIRIYIVRANSSGYNSSRPVSIMPHAYGSKPSYAPSMNFTQPDGSSAVVVSSFTRGQGKWIDVTEQWKELFSNGTVWGFGIYTSSTSNADYVRMTGAATIEITYEDIV